MKAVIAIGLLTTLACLPAYAHGGGLDRNGCHHDRKRGGYHCHRGPSIDAPDPKPAPSNSEREKPQTLLGGSAADIAYDADVETAQRLLAKLGYDPGPPDGKLGERTRAAVRAFESDSALPVAGEVTQDLINAMIEKLGD